jgi:pyruvate dehydrogenase E2 component (dihydrolipoamide acetyltransferase)
VSDAAGIKGTVEIVEPTRAERTIARRVAESRATVPDLTLAVDVSMTAALALAGDRRASLTALLVRAAALAVRAHPRANAAYRDGHFELYSRVNAGVVVAPGEAATVLDADQKTLEHLTVEIDDLERRASELTSPELSGATFTIARYGVTRALALITPPHAVALAAGEVREVPVVRDGAVVAGPLLALTLTCDHRILYGDHAAAVLGEIRRLLESAAL